MTFSSDHTTKSTLIKSLIFRNSRLYYYRKGLKTPKELLFKENLPVSRFQSLKPDDIKVDHLGDATEQMPKVDF